eukprot:3023215-Pyramimonas_sp.AAC.1
MAMRMMIRTRKGKDKSGGLNRVEAALRRVAHSLPGDLGRGVELLGAAQNREFRMVFGRWAPR